MATDMPRFRREDTPLSRRCGPFLLSLVYCVACVYFCCVIQVIVQHRAQVFDEIPDKYNMTARDREQVNTLPDLLFDLVPRLKYSQLADFWVLSFFLITLVRFMLTNMRLTIFRRWMFCLGTLFAMRGMTIVITLLPSPDKSCKSDTDVERLFFSALLTLFMASRTCADVMFSGHTVNGTLCTLVWIEYAPVVPLYQSEWLPAKFLKWIVLSFTLVGYITIIATHFHYSVDVLVGILLTVLVWKLYHNYVYNMLHYRKHTCLFWILSRMEQHAEDVDLVWSLPMGRSTLQAHGSSEQLARVEASRNPLLASDGSTPTYESFSTLVASAGPNL